MKVLKARKNELESIILQGHVKNDTDYRTYVSTLKLIDQLLTLELIERDYEEKI